VVTKRKVIDFGVNTEENFDLQDTTFYSTPNYPIRYRIHSFEIIDQETTTFKPLPETELTVNSQGFNKFPVIQDTIKEIPSYFEGNDTISNAKKMSKVPFERKTFHRNITRTIRSSTEPVVEKKVTKSEIESPNVILIANEEKSVKISTNNKRKAFRKKQSLGSQEIYLMEKKQMADL
jgi:hypothetical protein